jgi:signal recognition particle receptor subunit beta
MSFVNFAKREIQLKIVYYGPGRGGKTTNLQVIHEMVQDETKGKLISLSTVGDRTLFFDCMPLTANVIEGFTTRFLLYTVPGQVMYNETRRLVLKGVDGLVFVADSQWNLMPENVESLANLRENLRLQNESLDQIPYVLQYNKRDLPDVAPEQMLDFTLNNGQEKLAAFPAVATTGEGVFETLNMICRLVLHKFIKTHRTSTTASTASIPGVINTPTAAAATPASATTSRK